MAITSSAGDGVRVTTAAWSEALATQAQANGIDEIVVSNTLAASNNGNVWGSAAYAGDNRKIILRRGTSTEETRYVTAETAGTGTTRILTVNEPWDVPPATSDQFDVSYNLDDCATLTGVTLNSKTGVYEFGRNFRVGSGSAFGYFAMVNGQGLEMDDDANTRYTARVEAQGRWDIGYQQGGAAIQGAFLFSVHNAAGEDAFEIVDTGVFRGYNWIFLSQVVTTEQNIASGTGSDIIVDGFQWTKATYEIKMFQGTWRNGIISGEAGATTENIRIAEGVTIEDWLVAITNGFTTASGDTSTETLTIKNVNFVGNSTLITVNSNKTWNVINPTWVVDTTTQNDIDFLTSTNNIVNERYSIDAVIQTPGGTKLNGALVILYEGTQTDNLDLVLVADADGQANGSYVYAEYTDNANTSLNATYYGNHAIRVFRYGYNPSVGAKISDAPLDTISVLTVDSAITESSQAAAITAGSGITPVRHGTGETDTRPLKVLGYDGGTGSVPTVGETITQGSATGVVVEYLGDAVSGTLVLESWNGTEFTDGQTMSGGTSSFNVQTDLIGGTGFYEEYTWEIDCNNKSLAITYDYLAAKMADYSGSPLAFDAVFEQLHEWGKDEQGQALYSGGSGYFTERSFGAGSPAPGEGVWLSNRGSGTIAYLTSDSGVTYTPPASYTFSVTGIQTNSEIRIITADGNRTFVDGTENTTGGVTKATIRNGGTGYTVNDVLTVVGGTGTAAQLTVTAVSGGVITAVSITNPGSYSANPTNPVLVTGGTGTGARFTLSISGSFSYTYTYSADIDVYVVVFHLDYKEIRLTDLILSNSNQSIPIQQQTDRVYSNP